MLGKSANCCAPFKMQQHDGITLSLFFTSNTRVHTHTYTRKLHPARYTRSYTRSRLRLDSISIVVRLPGRSNNYGNRRLALFSGAFSRRRISRNSATREYREDRGRKEGNGEKKGKIERFCFRYPVVPNEYVGNVAFSTVVLISHAVPCFLRSSFFFFSLDFFPR